MSVHVEADDDGSCLQGVKRVAGQSPQYLQIACKLIIDKCHRYTYHIREIDNRYQLDRAGRMAMGSS